MKKSKIDSLSAKLLAEPIGTIGAIVALSAVALQFLSYHMDYVRWSEELLPLVFQARSDNYRFGDEKLDQFGNRKAQSSFGISISNPSTVARQISSCEIRFVSSDRDGYALKSTKCPQFEKAALTIGLSIPPGQEIHFTETFEGDVSVESLVASGVELQRANLIITKKTCEVDSNVGFLYQSCPFLLKPSLGDQIKLFAVYFTTGRNETFAIPVYLKFNYNQQIDDLRKFQDLR